MWVCVSKKNNTERESVYVFVWEICAPVYGSLSPPRAGQNGTGRRAPNWAQMAATDRDGGDINTLINNYLNNDTGYTGVGGRGDRRTGGEKDTGREDMRKTER